MSWAARRGRSASSSARSRSCASWQAGIQGRVQGRAQGRAQDRATAATRGKRARAERSMDATTAQRSGESGDPGGTPGGIIKVVDIARIMHAIPHRYPFLMIDRVVEVVPNVSAIGIKNVSVNEAFFQGHFPRQPVMPGVLIIESMAQTAAVLVVETLGEEAAGRVVYFMSVERAKFRRPVVPGDQLRIHCAKQRNRGQVWKFHAVARVDGVSVAEASYAAMIMDKSGA